MKFDKKVFKITTISTAVIIVVMLVISLIGKNSEAEIPATVVNVETIKEGLIENADTYQGTLISRHSVAIQPQVSGQIASINVKPGQIVSAGQTLLVIDPRKQQATLNSSKADAASMKASIGQAKSILNTYEVQQSSLVLNYQITKTQYERYRDLYARKTVSKQDLENYTDAYRKAKSALDANTAQIKAQKSAVNVSISNYQKSTFVIKEQSVELAYYRIVAPYSGIIGDIPVKVGEFVTSETKLLSVTQNNQLELNVSLPSEKAFTINKGIQVEILDDKGNIVATSTISFVSPQVETDTQTILTKSTIKNPKGILKADQSVTTKIVYGKTKGLLVPTIAVIHFGGQDFVFVVEKNKDKNIVKSGLKAGSCIVTKGIQKLTDGAPIKIEAREKD